MDEIFETLHPQPLNGPLSGPLSGQGSGAGALGVAPFQTPAAAMAQPQPGAPQGALQDVQGSGLDCAPFDLPTAPPSTQALGDPTTQRVMEDFLNEHPSMSQVLRVGSLEGEGDALTNLMSVCAWRYSGSEIADEELADLVMSFFELCLRNRVELLAQS